MKLYATPRSHFSRKVRLLLDHLERPYELIDVGDVADERAERFGGSPVLAVPVLEDGETWLIDSDHIAHYVVRTYDRGDRYAVLDPRPELLNARAVMNGIMANEVKLILSARTGLDPGPHAYFGKAKRAIAQCLRWLEARAELFSGDSVNYAKFHLIALWDHLELYGVVGLEYPRLERIAKRLRSSEKVRRSAPA